MARDRLVHELREPQRDRAGGKSLGSAAVPLGGVGAGGADRGQGGKDQREGE